MLAQLSVLAFCHLEDVKTLMQWIYCLDESHQRVCQYIMFDQLKLVQSQQIFNVRIKIILFNHFL